MTLAQYLAQIDDKREYGGNVKVLALRALRIFASTRSQMQILNAVYCAGLATGKKRA